MRFCLLPFVAIASLAFAAPCGGNEVALNSHWTLVGDFASDAEGKTNAGITSYVFGKTSDGRPFAASAISMSFDPKKQELQLDGYPAFVVDGDLVQSKRKKKSKIWIQANGKHKIEECACFTIKFGKRATAQDPYEKVVFEAIDQGWARATRKS
jgi:hypothetical protein